MAALTLGAIAVGCGQGATSPASSSGHQGTVQITYWYPWGGDSEKWDKWRIAKFQKENKNIKINAVYVPPDGGISNGKLLAAIAGHNPPDLVITNDPQAGYALAAKGALEPLDSYLKQLHFNEADLIPSFQSLMKYDGQTYLFPEDTNVEMLYYNVDLFKQAGLDPNKPPRTIAELDADAEKLTKISSSGTIQRMGFIPWIDDGDNPFVWSWTFGANLYNPKTNRMDLDSTQMVDMMNWMGSYAKKYNPEKLKSFTSGFGGAFTPDHPFFTGKVAMTVSGNWFSNALRIYAPNVHYKVAPLPAPPGGRADSTIFGTNVFMIPKGAKHPLEALKFAIWGSQGNILASDINTWRSVAVNQSSTKGIKFYNSNGQITDPIYKTVMKLAESPKSGTPALTSVASEMSNGLTSIRDKVIYNHADPGPLLKALQDKLQSEVGPPKS
ncbi:MAG: ABC transporter substrate-binding protein [Alicyclobacillus shizuokensis]|nr:ABC transporter substrate-binding protein [Alicyclobacillus shizuokensis]